MTGAFGRLAATSYLLKRQVRALCYGGGPWPLLSHAVCHERAELIKFDLSCLVYVNRRHHSVHCLVGNLDWH